MNAQLAGMLYEALKLKFFDDAQDILCECELDPMIVKVIEVYKKETLVVTMRMVEYPKRVKMIKNAIDNK